MKRKKKLKSKSLNLKSNAYVYYFFGFLAIFISVFIFFSFYHKNAVACANSISCIKDLSGKYDEKAKFGIFMGNSIAVPPDRNTKFPMSTILGDSTISNKHIYVDLSNQKLYAKEGDNTVYEFLISSGKWGKTPTGDFTTWIKLKATRMKGGSKELGTFYDLPNVPYTMFFYNNNVPKYLGYSIHGAYWHNNFGHPMSHGCINMRPDEAKIIYDWSDPPTTGFVTNIDKDHPGIPITIYGKAPNT